MPQWDFLDFLADAGAAATRPSTLRMQAEVDRPDRGGRPRRRRARARRPTGRSRSRADLDGRLRRPPLACCASAPGSRSRTSARRSTCCGSASRRDPDDSADTLAPHRRRPHHRDARPRRLLAVRLRHPQGRRRAHARRGLDAFRDERRGGRAVARRPRRRDRDVGRRQAAHRQRRPADAAGTGRACCASATRRTPCRRSAASASTSPSRTRSPPPTCSRRSSRDGTLDDDDLDAVQRRRAVPDARHAAPAGADPEQRAGAGARTARTPPLDIPLPLRVVDALPPLQRLLARVLGMGVRPEHVESPVAGVD